MKLCEVYDPDVQGKAQITKSGEGGRLHRTRKKSEPEIRRTKAVGGGKTEPAKSYKARKDIGTQKPRSTREQQPEKERGSAGLSPKEQQRKAYKERKAREAGAKTKTASELLTKKSKPKSDPNYKPQKASGLTKKERNKQLRTGEKVLRDIRLKNLGKKKESELKNPVTHSEIARRKKEGK